MDVEVEWNVSKETGCIATRYLSIFRNVQLLNLISKPEIVSEI